jgi:sRNA-binding regulator protein Hfq
MTTNRKMTEHSFLSALVAEGTVINLYLQSGVKLCGVLEAFDMDTLFLRSIGHGGGVQMIYKICASTLSPLVKGQRRTDMKTLNDVISDLVDRAEVEGG